MKRISLVLIAIVISIAGVFAQKYNDLITTDLTVVKRISDSLALNAKRKFIFDHEGMAFGKYAVVYTNVSDSKENIAIMFKRIMVGSNDALEIKGTPTYYFDYVIGNFLDIFPFWKSFIDNNANSELIASGRKMVTKELVFSNGEKYLFTFLDTGNNNWRLYSRKQ